MKKVGPVPGATENAASPQAGRPPVPTHADGRTRQGVARLLLEQGPITAAAVADQLGLSAPAVRRHLDALLADGEVRTREAPSRGRRSRGRPAKLYLLTEAGRARFGHAYDDLAVAAIRFLAEHSGDPAVREFARARMASLVDRHRRSVQSVDGVEAKAKALATALTREGYAASARRVGAGEQLCQHHCPVAHVASEFPELCEAETAAFAELLGTHVQRLATIARGDAACTTHIPVVAPAKEQPGNTASNKGTPIPDGGKPA